MFRPRKRALSARIRPQFAGKAAARRSAGRGPAARAALRGVDALAEERVELGRVVLDVPEARRRTAPRPPASRPTWTGGPAHGAPPAGGCGGAPSAHS